MSVGVDVVSGCESTPGNPAAGTPEAVATVASSHLVRRRGDGAQHLEASLDVLRPRRGLRLGQQRLQIGALSLHSGDKRG